MLCNARQWAFFLKLVKGDNVFVGSIVEFERALREPTGHPGTVSHHLFKQLGQTGNRQSVYSDPVRPF